MRPAGMTLDDTLEIVDALQTACAGRLPVDHEPACEARTSRTRPSTRASRSTSPKPVKAGRRRAGHRCGPVPASRPRRAGPRRRPRRLRRLRARDARRPGVGDEGARGARRRDPAVRRLRPGLPPGRGTRRLRGQRPPRAGAGVGPACACAASRRVVVAGGGPAGLEAARVAAEAGHEVVLYERTDAVGGQLRVAAAGPTREELLDFVFYLERELEPPRRRRAPRHRRHARRGPRRTRPISSSARPARLRSRRSSMRTATRRSSPSGTCSAAACKDIPERAVVVDDGSGFWHGISAAEFLAERGAAVELVDARARCRARDPARERRERQHAASRQRRALPPSCDRHRRERLDGLARRRRQRRARTRRAPTSSSSGRGCA